MYLHTCKSDFEFMIEVKIKINMRRYNGFALSVASFNYKCRICITYTYYVNIISNTIYTSIGFAVTENCEYICIICTTFAKNCMIVS